MSTTTDISTLVINYLSEEQYNTALNAGTLSANELYFTPGANLATVATTGSYNDLIDKPTIGSKISTTATLAAANWSDNSQTITVNGVTSTNDIIISPSATSEEAYSNAGVKGTAQGTNSLTFECDSTPEVDLGVDLLIFT